MDKGYQDYYRRLGLNIAYFRKMRGLTQAELGEKIGIDQTHLSKIEVASIGLSLDVLFALSKALDISPDKLLGQLLLSE